MFAGTRMSAWIIRQEPTSPFTRTTGAGVRMSTTRSVSMKAEATGPATIGPSSNRPDTVACAMRPPQWGGLILGHSRLPLEKRPPQGGSLTWDLWRGAQAGPWVSAIKTATTGAPAVEQPAHHGVA